MHVDNLQEWVLSFYHVASRHQTQRVSLTDKLVYPRSHLNDHPEYSLELIKLPNCSKIRCNFFQISKKKIKVIFWEWNE